MKIKLVSVVSLFFGFLLGIIATGVFISVSSDDMMIKEFQSPYDFDKTVSVMAERINSKQGWHVSNIIDQNKEVQTHGGVPIGNFKIIQYCNGKYSSQMLKADDRKKIGSILPKTFAVYQKLDGTVYVSTLNGSILGKFFGGETEKITEQVSLEVEDMMRFINLKHKLY